MKSDSTEGRQWAARLRELLAPELATLLSAGQPLPAELVAAECTRLHADLTAMASYIPTPIVAAQLAVPQPGRVSGAYWDGSVLFADLNGFTALSERLSALGRQGAEELSAIINRLFGALTEEIHRHSGAVLKFGGDALTAFFDAAALGGQHAQLASQAALALNRRMDAFAELVTPAGTFRLRLRVGVHSGQVFAAQVGDDDHIELVVTGHDINRVALAQEIAVPGQVVISDATAALLPQASLRPSEQGFVQLLDLPAADLPAPAPAPVPARAAGDLDELLALASWTEALRPYLPRGLPRRFLEPFGSAAGEFRTVSVLFANFFPFSALLDLLPGAADTAACLLNAYYCRAQRIVHHYGGIVNKVDMYTHGDKLMALFGAPVSHESDPLFSVRAALELRDALHEINAEIGTLLAAASPSATFDGFVQRIGIHTGVVFAGQVGAAQRREYTVMGQHVNMAARLMAAADFGSVLLSPASRRAVERYVAVRECPPLLLKGLTEPVQPALVIEAREVAQEPRTSIGRATLIGRDEELNELLFEGSVALAGSGRAVALVGEAGTGKTRLIEDALRHLVMRSGEGRVPAFFAYSVECQSYEQTNPYAVIRELLRQVFNLQVYRVQPAHEPIATDSLLARVAELVPALARFAPLLGDLMGVALPDTPLTAALTPEQRHDRAQELVEALVLAEAAAQPLVLIIDDLHWADASSLELIARLAHQAPDRPLLLLLGYRDDPPIAEPWCEMGHCRRVLIRELSPDSSAALVRALLGDDPPDHLTTLLERAQGNPFFVEEVVRDLVELGALHHDEAGWRLAETFDEAAIPDSIEGVITARLDRLEERSREVLQTAAVIGRRFAYQVLSGVVTNRESLIDRLGRLSAADLIMLEDLESRNDTISPLLAYLFKHALTRDVAYEAILYARRRDLHRRVARHMEQIYADRLDDYLALLARHYLLAEEWPLAFDYHLRAGRQAQARYANREAIALLGRALQIATQQTSGPWVAGPPAVVELHERLGVIYALLGEYDAALAHYQAGLAMPDLLHEAQVRLHYLVARVYEKRAEFDTAFGWVERALALADDRHDPERIPCLLLGAGLHKRQGRYSQASEWCEHALRLAEEHARLRDQAQAFKLLGNIANSLGENSRALDLIRRSSDLYEQIQDLDGISYAHNDLAIIYHELGRLSEARTHYEAGAEIKQAIGDIYGQGIIACNLGEVFRIQDKLEEAIAQYSHGLSIYERIGSLYPIGVLHMNLGATYLLLGELESAERHLNRSGELFEQVGAEEFLPELERYLAELYIQRGDLARARQACGFSLTTAARLEARTEEGATRRTLSQIRLRDGNIRAAWEELERSLAILREAASLHEIAKTLLRMADLAPALDRYAVGQAALTEAWPALNEVGAQRDIAEACLIAERHGYQLPA